MCSSECQTFTFCHRKLKQSSIIKWSPIWQQCKSIQTEVFNSQLQLSCHTTFPPGLLGHHITLGPSHNLSDNHEYISQPLLMLLPFTAFPQWYKPLNCRVKNPLNASLLHHLPLLKSISQPAIRILLHWWATHDQGETTSLSPDTHFHLRDFIEPRAITKRRRGKGNPIQLSLHL